MNRFVTFAVLALACVSVARSQELDEKEYSTFKLTTDDATETAKLGEQFAAYDKFCLAARDYIVNDVKSSSNQLAAQVFSLIFDSADAMGRDTLAVTKMGSERLAAQLANPSAAIQPASNDAEQIIADGQTKVAERSAPLSMFEAIKSVATAGANEVRKMLESKFNNLKGLVSWETLAKASAESCARVQSYEAKLKEDFEAFKAQVGGDASLTMNKVPCVTSTRISQVDGMCKFAMTVKNAADKVRQSKAN